MSDGHENFNERLERVKEEKLATKEQLRSGSDVNVSPAPNRRSQSRFAYFRENYPRLSAFAFGFVLTWVVGGISLFLGSMPAFKESWVAMQSAELFKTLSLLGGVGLVIFVTIDRFIWVFMSERDENDISSPVALMAGIVLASFMTYKVSNWVQEQFPPPEQPEWWEFWK